MRKLQEQDANEHVEEKEATDDDEQEEKHDGRTDLVVIRRSIPIIIGRVVCLLEDVRPSFKTGNYEQRHEAIPGVVEIVIVSHP